MEDKLVGTVTEFAALWNVEYAVASNTINFLKTIGVAQKIGERKRPDNKGKASIVFELPKQAMISFEKRV